MDLSNGEIADALEELGDLYELDGAIAYRVLAYRTAARAVREASVSVSVAALAREGRATELAGIGKTLQEKIQALIETGTIPATQKLRAKFPPGLIEITRLRGIGAKRARLLHAELQIDSLRACARRHWRSACAPSRASGQSSRKTCSARSRRPPRRATVDGRGCCSRRRSSSARRLPGGSNRAAPAPVRR